MTMPSSAERFERTNPADPRSTMEQTREHASDLTSQVSEKAGEYAEEARRRASEMTESAKAYGRDAQHAVSDVAGNFREALERSIERQPMTTVLLAMAAGVVIGGILRR